MLRFVLLACLALAAAAPAGTGAQAPPPVPVDEAGVAIGGYDAVTYHREGRAAPGSAQHEAEWRGATWRFDSAEARAAFAADPEAYAPAYHGWCAWAMSEDRLAAADPRVWRIVAGRLFLNCSEAAKRRWEADLAAAIARADANWARRMEEAGAEAAAE